MTTNAGVCQAVNGVRVDDGDCNTGFYVPDPRFRFNIGFNFVVQDPANSMIRPLESVLTADLDGNSLVFLGIVNSNQFAGEYVEKKMKVYHCGSAELYISVATAAVEGDRLQPYVDPATSAVSNSTFVINQGVADPNDIMTVCGLCGPCADYANDPCYAESVPTDSSTTPALAVNTVTKVRANWCVAKCGC